MYSRFRKPAIETEKCREMACPARRVRGGASPGGSAGCRELAAAAAREQENGHMTCKGS